MHNPYLFFKTNNKNLVLPEFFNLFPPEIFDQILDYLEIKNLRVLCHTSKTLQQNINSSINSNAKFSDLILASAIKHAFTPIINLQIVDSLLTHTEFNHTPLTTRENFFITQRLLNNGSNRNNSFIPRVKVVSLFETFKTVATLSSLAILALLILFNTDNIQLQSFSVLIVAITVILIINQIESFHQNTLNLNKELVSLRNKIHEGDESYYSSSLLNIHQKFLLEAILHLYPGINLSLNKSQLVAPIEYTKKIISTYLQDIFDKLNIKNNDLYQHILEQLDQSIEFKKITSLQIS